MLAQLTAYKYDQLNRLMQIKEVTRSVGCYKYNLKFEYDPMGNRIAKHVFNNNDEKLYSEYYVRDAQGNIISVYKLSIDESEQLASFVQAELHIYGSSMLGMYKPETELISSIPQGNIYTNYLGKKHFTGSNHLGNTLAVFSDIKHQSDYNNDNIVDNYTADLLSANDYAPFGGLLTERTFNKGTFPNTFNGKRDDPELSDWQDYGMRMYSPWARRFPTVDPIAKAYPWYTPYQFAGNKPIWAVDLDGLEDIVYIYIMQGKEKTLLQKIDYNQTSEGTGPLGHGTYTAIISANGVTFSETFFSTKSNSISSFSGSNIKRKNYPNVETRLNARLIEKTVENALENIGFNRNELEKDVIVLDTDQPGFVGKFASFREGTANKYTKNWTERNFSSPHKSTKAKGSGLLGKTTLELKYYNGESSSNDNVPNHIGFTQYSGSLTGYISHILESIDAISGTNTGAENAKAYKSDYEDK